MQINTSNQIKKATETKNSFIKLEEGKTRLHIVSGIYGVREHRVKIKDQERTIICPKAMDYWEADEQGRQPNPEIKCPVCESDDRTWKTQFQAVAITDNGTVGILKKGKQIFNALVELQEAGYDFENTMFVINRTGQNLDTEYSVIAEKGDKPLTDEEKLAVGEFMKDYDIEQYTKPMSYENIQRKLKGEDPIFDDTE